MDVYDGTLTMEFEGEIINFDRNDAMKYPSDDHSVFGIYFIDSLMQKFLSLIMVM